MARRGRILVIGSGIAGLTFALKASEFADIELITKKEDTESNTNYAQGGIAAVMSADDSPELHIRDTLAAGAGLCRRDAVEQMVCEGPERVRELIDWGARFSRTAPDEQSAFSLGREGGHSRNRIIHAHDLTGREVERALISAVKQHRSIRVHEHWAAIELIQQRHGGQVLGVEVLDTQAGCCRRLYGSLTVLATGGAGQVYLHTTNPDIATGDGVAMAFRAGAQVANMEFIQFHPTTLYHPTARSFLISEAVRGEGGVLRLQDGTPFMARYHEMESLAPRDIVARAIDEELKRTGDDYALLDVTHLPPGFAASRFPHIYKICGDLGIDITREPIPIVPAAHYSCGGVLTDLQAQTSLQGLLAIGEVACTGVHGANRLASNSLLEALVFAHHGAAAAAAWIEKASGDRLPDSMSPIPASAADVSPEFAASLRTLVRTVMWNHVGIVRSNRRLTQALREVELVRKAVNSLFRDCQPTPELVEFRNLTQVAAVIVRSALDRAESRGLHYNTDYPLTRDDCLHETVLTLPEEGPPAVAHLPIRT